MHHTHALFCAHSEKVLGTYFYKQTKNYNFFWFQGSYSLHRITFRHNTLNAAFYYDSDDCSLQLFFSSGSLCHVLHSTSTEPNVNCVFASRETFCVPEMHACTFNFGQKQKFINCIIAFVKWLNRSSLRCLWCPKCIVRNKKDAQSCMQIVNFYCFCTIKLWCFVCVCVQCKKMDRWCQLQKVQ